MVNFEGTYNKSLQKKQQNINFINKGKGIKTRQNDKWTIKKVGSFPTTQQVHLPKEIWKRWTSKT